MTDGRLLNDTTNGSDGSAQSGASQPQRSSQQQSAAQSCHQSTQSQPPAQPKQQQQQRAAYPWSQRQLVLKPPATAQGRDRDTPAATVASPSPFPRYGHALNATASATGELFLFGGLVGDVAKNDLYLISTRPGDLSATLLQSFGEIPSPRFEHASAIVGNVLIVWGGDTRTSTQEKQLHTYDDGLYLLNLVSREWTRVSTYGTAPSGRYRHAVAMVESKFYVFGGQANGEFFNDLWSFDLNSLRTRAKWERVEPGVEGSPKPSKRTGHTCLAYGGKIVMFGGTDGQYHYNDTWTFDTTSNTWSELSCIGYIPSAREGHAAALVDDVVYIYGGRGVDGKDLGELGALKVSSQRWFMFQKMGPAPSARSGHAMASTDTRAFVLGGLSGASEKPEDPDRIHVLETKHIKYPPHPRTDERSQIERSTNVNS